MNAPAGEKVCTSVSSSIELSTAASSSACTVDGRFEVARDRTGDHDPIRVARGSDEVDSEAADVVDRVQQGAELPVAGVAGARVKVAQVQRATEDPVDLGGGPGHDGCWDISKSPMHISWLVAEANDATLLTLDQRLVATVIARDRVEALAP